MKKLNKGIALLLSLVMALSVMCVGAFATYNPTSVAEDVENANVSIVIGEETKYFASLAEAYQAAIDNGTGQSYTIEVLKSHEGGGFGSDGDAGITYTVNFNNHSYTVTRDLVGSTGYESQAVRVISGQTVVMNNGTIDSSAAYMMFNIYSDLTLNGMTIDGSSLLGDAPYTLSCNKGHIVLTGNTNIIAKSGGYAFDCWGKYSNWGTNVKVEADDNFTGSVSGKVEYTANAGNAALDIKAGDFTGATFIYAIGEGKTAVIDITGGTFSDPSIARYVKSGDVTVDLGGKTVTKDRVFTAYAGNVTITNGTLVGRVDAYDASTVTIESDATVNGMVVVWGDGTFDGAGCKTPTLNVYGTINNESEQAISTNGTDKSKPNINIFSGANVTGGMGIYLPSGALTISGGEITGEVAVYFKSTDITISGGTLRGTGTSESYEYNGNGANSTGDALVIDSCNYPAGIGTIDISGGTFVSDHNHAVGSYNSNGGDLQTKFITGGIFNTTLDTALIADSYAQRNAGYGFAEGQVVSNTAYTNAVNAYWASLDYTPSTPATTQPATTTIEEEATPLAALPESLSDVTVTVTNEAGEQVEVTAAELPTVYADVAEESYARDAIAYVTALGLMNGVGNDGNGEASFAPQAATTSEMLTTVLYRAVSGEETSGENWAEDAVAWAEDANLTEGLGLESGKDVTREQMVTMMYRIAEARGFDVSAAADLDGYADADGLSDFALAAMKWAVSVGLINGTDVDKLSPDGNVTREQIATILMRFNELTKDVA